LHEPWLYYQVADTLVFGTVVYAVLLYKKAASSAFFMCIHVEGHIHPIMDDPEYKMEYGSLSSSATNCHVVNDNDDNQHHLLVHIIGWYANNGTSIVLYYLI